MCCGNNNFGRCNNSDNYVGGNHMCLIKTLCCNVGKNCTIQTAGGTFTGKIEGVNREMVRLNTGSPCEPSHSKGPCDDICSSRPRPPVVQRYCDVMLNKIEAVCF